MLWTRTFVLYSLQLSPVHWTIELMEIVWCINLWWIFGTIRTIPVQIRHSSKSAKHHTARQRQCTQTHMHTVRKWEKEREKISQYRQWIHYDFNKSQINWHENANGMSKFSRVAITAPRQKCERKQRSNESKKIIRQIWPFGSAKQILIIIYNFVSYWNVCVCTESTHTWKIKRHSVGYANTQMRSA